MTVELSPRGSRGWPGTSPTQRCLWGEPRTVMWSALFGRYARVDARSTARWSVRTLDANFSCCGRTCEEMDKSRGHADGGRGPARLPMFTGGRPRRAARSIRGTCPWHDRVGWTSLQPCPAGVSVRSPTGRRACLSNYKIVAPSGITQRRRRICSSRGAIVGLQRSYVRPLAVPGIAP
jgi:hypothetical protein